METLLSERKLGEKLSEVLDRVRAGERFIVERDGERIAVLSPPLPEPPGITGRELSERIGHLYMPGDGFADDIESARTGLVPALIPPWPD